MSIDFNILGKIDSLLIGMRANIINRKYNTSVARMDSINSQLTKITENFRGVYDSTMPNIHIVKPKVLARDVLITLLNKPELLFNVPKGTDISEIFTESVQRLIKDKIVTRIIELHARLPKSIDPIGELNRGIDRELKDVLNVLHNTQIDSTTKEKRVFALGFDLAQLVNSIFKSKALLAVDSNDIGISTDYLVFFGRSFAGMKKVINEEITDVLKTSVLASTNLKGIVNPNSTISTGDIIHFGHSAIYHETIENNKKVGTYGFNSPASTNLIYAAINQVDNTKIANNAIHNIHTTFITKTGHATFKISVSKDIDNTLGNLLALGITITQDQTAIDNLGMSSVEKDKSSVYGDSKAVSVFMTSKNLAEFVKFKILSGSFSNILFARASANLVEMLTDKLVSTISGKKPTLPAKTSSTKIYEQTSKIKEIKQLELNQSSKIAKFSIKDNSNTSSSSSQLRDIKGRFYSLANLQVLLNIHLQDVISANMGNEPWPGGQRKILNYRTGRFASTVAVERLSQSRQGAITAFYSYMKYPYATFSEGGRQSIPKSRDPKLLISKSIHEIAATMVGNKLKAVAV